MSSIIPGYNYDIFISYRQKDNKGDRWVSEFVEALKTELESTFKEEISVYFDINPHDGLLETHDVDESLKEKLKCLVFIPIISRTYCDPKSFAWVHEFKAFIEQASKDQYGLKVKLPGGNVANRVLPVQIHDLDADDRKMVENELGGHLRGIEFIYREAGIDKPLAPDDDENKNLNSTKYGIQIVKVAHAVKDIISAIKQYNPEHKEEESHEVKKPVSPLRKNHKKSVIIGSAMALALMILGILFVPRLFKPLEKSIAVLPFINESPVDSNKYFINGIMEEVLNNLQAIKEFRVVSRTSTDQYKDHDRPTIPEIARKLGVNYIVEGSGQMYGKTFILRVQLIKAKRKEDHEWGDTYKKEIREVSDYIEIPSQIAQAIAAELKTVLTPSEKQLIEKKTTSSLMAHEFYLRGNQELNQYSSGNLLTRGALDRAERMYKKALEFDSTFAQVYVGFAKVYWYKHYWSEYFSDTYLDSVLFLANKAISFDSQLAEAYTIRGKYYSDIGKPELAAKEIDKAIKLNPNDWSSYLIKAQNPGGDLLAGIENYHKVYSLNRGSESPGYLRALSDLYLNAGFIEKARYYAREAFRLDGDSLKFYLNSGWIETWSGNYLKGLENANKAYSMDSTNLTGLHLLGHTQMFLRNYDEALFYFKKYIECQQAAGQLNLVDLEDLGFANWQSGNKEEAEECFSKEIEYCNKAISLGRSFGNTGAYYELAAIYAVKGDRDKALKNLEFFWQQQELVVVADKIIYVQVLKDDPVFDNMRNDTDFQKIVMKINSKYQYDHERVRKWLEENDML
ncbi:MAG: hypothetical protein JW903_10840 [Clostridia bacterium]|nr:hypothetical protein [Clostridia bacterium]